MNSYYIKGTRIDLTYPSDVLKFIENYSFVNNGYICLFGLYPLSVSFNDKYLQKAFNNSELNPIHGKSIEKYLKLKGKENIGTIDGVYLLDNLLKTNLSHVFYGTNSTTLDKIKYIINDEYSDPLVLDYKPPPFFKLNEIEKNKKLEKDFKNINKLKPNIIWIGLGGIKQDLVMMNYTKYCQNSLMIGVGAAFNYFAGEIEMSSKFIKNIGLRWLDRAVKDPKVFKRIFKMSSNLMSSFFKNGRG